LFGVAPRNDCRFNITQVSSLSVTLRLHFGRVLTGSEGGQSQPDKNIPEILRVLGEKNIAWRGFVSHRGELADLEQIIQQMQSGSVTHAIIRFSA